MIGIAYEYNIDKARTIILETLRNSKGVIYNETHEVIVAVHELGVSTVNVRVLFWVNTKEYRKQAIQLKSEII